MGLVFLSMEVINWQKREESGKRFWNTYFPVMEISTYYIERYTVKHSDSSNIFILSKLMIRQTKGMNTK